MTRGVRRRLLAATIGVLGLAGCGIPTDDAPRAISRENVPDDVADAATETTAPETVGAAIFLVQAPDEGPRLVAVERPIPVESQSSRPTPAAVLEALLVAKANDEERVAGISNLIPESTRLASTPESLGTTLLIDLTRPIFDVAGENQRAAFGQIVCTADELDGVDAVQFRVDGEPIEAQTGSGATDQPVTCSRDYRRLLADTGESS
jgi:spore germination protein GerM